MKTEDIEHAAAPQKWPNWPWLPMKRYSAAKGLECAVLHADTGPRTKPVVLYDINMFEIRTYFPTADMKVAEQFNDWRAFAASNWQVD